MSALTIYNPPSNIATTLDEKLTYAEHFAQAGLFSDCRGMSQCLVKIQAGGELGFPPYASMNGISIIQGKPAIGGGMYNALIEASGDHDVEVLESSDKVATGRFWSKSKRTGQWVIKGEFSFRMEDAVRAGLAGKDNWKKNPIQMLFWRMISNGARMYFPALCAGLYMPEELGADVDATTGEILERVAPPPERSVRVVTNGAESSSSTRTGTKVTAKEARLAFEAKCDLYGYTGHVAELACKVLGYVPAKWDAATWQQAHDVAEDTWLAAIERLAPVAEAQGDSTESDEDETDEDLPEISMSDSASTIAAMAR